MKFRVEISGEDAERKIRSRRWLFFISDRTVRSGFFTTRFVEAESELDAIDSALRTAKGELKNMGRFDNGTVIEVEHVSEDPMGFDNNGPGTGFTFWKE